MKEIKYLKISDLSSYNKAFTLSNEVWEEVITWNYFEKSTVGSQLVRSLDSVSANIAEGFGRYSKKDKIKFYRYARGSVYESLDWLEKTKKRNLLSNKKYQSFYFSMGELPKEINQLISYTNSKLTI